MEYRRTLAASLSIVAGVLALILGLGIASDSGCPGTGCTSPGLQTVIAILGALLIIDALVIFAGVRLALGVGGLLSAAFAVVFLFEWAGQTSPVHAALTAIVLLALIVNIMAMRTRKKLPAGSHPMDMPVFG